MKRYLIPIFFSLIVSLIVWIISHDSTNSLIIGLLINLTFLVIEYFQIIIKVSDFLEIHRDLIGLTSQEVSVVSKMRQIHNSGDMLKKWLIEKSSIQLNNNLVNLLSDRWVVNSSENFAVIAEKMFEKENCQNDYCGTSVVGSFRGYWLAIPGRRYQDTMVNAISRGIRIKRVFIFSRIRIKKICTR